MRVYIEAVAVLAPGLPDWAAARDVLSGAKAFEAAPMATIVANSLPPAERRRSSPTVRLAIAVAEQALQQTALTAPEMAMVFASCEASGIITHQLCEALAGTREVSPTQFHNSVHNAPSGYFSIATGAKLAASSIARGKWSFAAGLLNAAAQANADQLPVLFVCYDSPLPAPLNEVMPMNEATAIALVLSPVPMAAHSPCWEIELRELGGELAAPTWPDWMPSAWQANASARGFAALATLASAGGSRQALLPLSPELNLRVTLLEHAQGSTLNSAQQNASAAAC